MKKVIAIFISAVLMLTTLAACGTNPAAGASSAAPSTESVAEEPSSAADEVPTEPVTIKFANHMVLEAGTEPFWTQFKKDFEAKYPNITIEYISAPYGEIVNTVINMAGGGDKVDMMLGEASWSPTLEEAGLTIPAKDIMGEEYMSDFFPGVLDALTVDGEAYGLPMYMTPFILFYNTQLFEQAGLDPNAPPKTYDEMLAMAEKLSTLTSGDGNKVYAFGQTTASVAISGSALTGMIYNFGGKVLDESGKLTTDNEGFKQAFEMLKTLDQKGYNPQNAKLKDLRNLFALGQLAMYYDQAWGYSGIQSINADAAAFTATAAPLSGGSGAGDSVVSAHSIFMMDNGENQKKAVALIIKELINEQTLGDFMSKVNLAYPAKNSMKDMAAIKESSILKGASGKLDCAKAVTTIPTLSDLNLELCTLAQAVTVSKQGFDEAYATFKSAAEAIVAG